MRRLIQSLSVLILGLLPVWALAQAGNSLTGKVTDSRTGGPLPGANIYLVEIQKGASTDVEGLYTIPNLNTGTYTLSVTFIGYTKYETSVNIQAGINTMDIVLQPAAIGLEDIVVTALGYEREKRSLGYAVQNVEGEQLTQARESNIVNAIAGKVAGVQINSSSGQPGKASRIIIRGNSSFLGDNQPLFVVDGIPISNAEDENPVNPTDNPVFFGGTSNRALDIDPNNIESISVLKGASATALYGSRASNGAVIITTKSGTMGRATPQITVSSRVGWDDAIVKGYQEDYLQGLFGAFRNGIPADRPGSYAEDGGNPQTTVSWGPHKDSVSTDVINDLIAVGYLPAGATSIPTYNPRKDFYQTGYTNENYVSLSSGFNGTSYFMSVSRLDQQGIVPGSELGRNNILAKFGSELSEDLRVHTSINYINTENKWLSEGNGSQNYNYGLNFTPISFDISDYQWEDGSQRNFASPFNNPVWISKNNRYTSSVDRFISNANVTYDILPWISIGERIGLDTYVDTRKEKINIGTVSIPDGSMFDQKIQRSEINSDLTVNFKRRLSEDFSLEGLIGNNINVRYYKTELIEGNGLNIPGFFNVSNANVVTANEAREKKRLVSLYGQATVDYQKYLFLTLTARNDWSSTLPKSDNSYFYPSVSLGLVFTDAIPSLQNNDILSFGKVRASISQIGSDAPAYSLSTNYVQSNPGDGVRGNVNFPYNGINGYDISNVLGNPDLKPEITTEFETGVDLRFFNERAGIDVAYYTRTTKDQIFSVPVTAATGYVSRLLNAGELKNEGVEVSLNMVPVRMRDFRWDIGVNFAKNTTTVEKLTEGVESIFIGGFTGAEIQIRPQKNGYGVIWTDGFKRVKDLPEDEQVAGVDPNAMLIGDDGLPLLTDSPVVMGNVQPDWTGNFRNTFSYKGLSLSTLIDVRHGGDIFNLDFYYTTFYGTSSRTSDRGSTYTYEGVKASDITQTNSEEIVRDEVFYRNWYSNALGNFVEDGGFVKLREVTLAYVLPISVIQNTPFQRIELSVTGRNLWMRTDFSLGDPEGNLLGGGNAQGFYHAVTPGTRSITGSIKVTI